ncbi:hypothetical protein, conserved [Eimeria brunetti]|uniref:Calcineurin-like phosphoesterase domain-containing protein n=1 Tax=Eimeria brunetti TaxID=51314 RepID=U6LN70_9EIME|nr:hypothetical protein, conserved [Eimeria brunetti]
MPSTPSCKIGRSLSLLCLATCIGGIAKVDAELGDGAHFGDRTTEGAFRQLAIAWVSDVHLQPHYSTLVPPMERCGPQRHEPPESPESAQRAILEVETAPELGRAGCGSSRMLFDKTLSFLNGLVAHSHAAEAAGHPMASSTDSSAAKTAFIHYPLPPINTILLTGDFAHSRKNADPNYIKEALKEFTNGLLKRFPQQSAVLRKRQSQVTATNGIQLVLVVGNHDFPPDALLPPQRTRWANILYNIWKPVLPEGELTRETFLRGMYYSTDLREAPQLRVLCLNTNLYAAKLRKAAKALLEANKDKGNEEDGDDSLPTAEEDEAEEVDPARQFEWLARELRSARARGQQVIICGHIMPAVTVRLNTFTYFRDNWENAYTTRYRDLISEYSDVVIAQLYGHQHEGTMVSLLPRGAPAWIAAAAAGPGCNPLQPSMPTALLTIPSISPQNGNNPAMRVLLFNALQNNREDLQPHGERNSPRAKVNAYALADYTQYHLPLYGFVGRSGFGRTDPEFEFESSFQDTFRPFLRCAKPRQLSLVDAAEGREICATSVGPRCIDGSTALQVADAVGRSPFAYVAYMNHRYAGGKDAASAAVSCSSLAVTEEDFIECIHQMK